MNENFAFKSTSTVVIPQSLCHEVTRFGLHAAMRAIKVTPCAESHNVSDKGFVDFDFFFAFVDVDADDDDGCKSSSLTSSSPPHCCFSRAVRLRGFGFLSTSYSTSTSMGLASIKVKWLSIFFIIISIRSRRLM